MRASSASPSRFLLESRGRPIRLGLGTHDVALIEQIADQVAAAGIGKDGYEVEMLYGIRTDQQLRLARAGYRVVSLIAYGEYWYPWYMRRLAERPANVWFAMRQILPFVAPRPNVRGPQARSKRSRFITLFHAATKSRTNFSFASSLA